MTTVGWIFMGVVWLGVSIVVVFSYYKVLTKKKDFKK